MLKSVLTASAVLASVLLCNVQASTEAVDLGGICGMTTAEDNMVDFTFEDGSTVLADGQIATATVALKEKHQANPPVAVEIVAPGFNCARQRFEFSAEDPDSFEQSVTCRTDSGSAPTKDSKQIDVAALFTYFVTHPDPKKLNGVIKKLCKKFLLQRLVETSGKGGGFGDPHVTTLDKVSYDFQKAGVYRFFESRNFQIQIFQEKCKPTAYRGEASPSCYQGVAVAFGDSIVRLLIEDGKIALGKGTSSLDWLSVEKLRGKTDGYRIFTTVDQATYVDVTLSKWINSYPYLNVVLQVSPYFRSKNVNGLMGNWNNNPRDDLRDSKQLAKFHGFVIDDNLFTCVDDECAKFLKPSSVRDDMARTLPNDMPLLHQGYMVVPPSSIVIKAFNPTLAAYKRSLEDVNATEASPANTTDMQYSPVEPSVGNDTSTSLPVSALGSNSASPEPTSGDETFDTDPIVPEATTPSAHDMFAVRAHDLCNQVITQIPACYKYVANQTFFIDSVCVGDALQLEDFSVIDNTKLTYLRDCRRELDSRIESDTSTSAELQLLKVDRETLKFGDLSTCANDCSGRGTCLAAGCKCNPGYTGFACDLTVL